MFDQAGENPHSATEETKYSLMYVSNAILDRIHYEIMTLKITLKYLWNQTEKLYKR